MYNKNFLNTEFRKFEDFNFLIDFVKNHSQKELIEYCVLLSSDTEEKLKKSKEIYSVNSNEILENAENIYVGTFKTPFVGGVTIKDALVDLKENIEEYEFVYKILEDSISKRTFLNYILYRMSLNERYLNDVFAGKKQYFIEEIFPIRNNAVFVDCGAYNGDTIEGWIKYSKNCFDKIYAYEPIDDNFIEIRKKYGNKKNIDIFNRGVWSKKEKLTFSSHMPNAANRVVPGGDVVVEVSSIDEDISEKIDFIKMDIEGAEQEALYGAQKHIKYDKPQLAICVYHTIQDIWKIPRIIYTMNPNQKFYLRYHNTDIPEEFVFYTNPNMECEDIDSFEIIDKSLELIETVSEAMNISRKYIEENKKKEACEMLDLTSIALERIQSSINIIYSKIK